MLIPSFLQEPLLNIAPLLTTAVIAPHGMTDLVHAENDDKVSQLFRINGLIVVSSILLQTVHMDNVINAVFAISSAIHFRHDFPIKSEFLKLCASTALVVNAESIGVELFICYMCFIHVPNHYNIYKPVLMNNLKRSFHYILVCAIIGTYALYSNLDIMHNGNVFTISKALIVSHIVYEEIYTKNNTVVNNVSLFE